MNASLIVEPEASGAVDRAGRRGAGADAVAGARQGLQVRAGGEAFQGGVEGRRLRTRRAGRELVAQEERLGLDLGQQVAAEEGDGGHPPVFQSLQRGPNRERLPRGLRLARAAPAEGAEKGAENGHAQPPQGE